VKWVDRSVLSQNVSSVITYHSLYYSSKVFFQNKEYTIGKEDPYMAYMLATSITNVLSRNILAIRNNAPKIYWII